MFRTLIVCLYFAGIFGKHVWWQNTTVYQIYPRSFKDSNGDGIGDLNGITDKLAHIKNIGIETLWISPIYPSPQIDFGYDISNFTDINKEYGTLEDFDDLIQKAKLLDLKVLMDFVPNHSSPEHEWFKKSVQKIKPYDDYYVWKDAKMVNNTRHPPNNWLCSFGGSAWEWNSQRGQYYFHQFAIGQADLNYRSAALRKEMENALLFWVKRGVSGFRIDAINTLFEDARFLDEPRSGKPVPSDDTEYLSHIYTLDQNETYDVVESWKNIFTNYSQTNELPDILTLTEAYTTIPLTMKYYEYGSRLPMNFYLITELNNMTTAMSMKRTIQKWLNNIPSGQTANWVTGNHDQPRVATRMGLKREDQLTALAMILPGVAIIYNGDELGMVNKWLSYNQTLDPLGCGAGPDRYQLKSRDPERTPYQWDNTTSAGFSNNTRTWLPVHENYKTLNLEAEKNANISHYKVFKALTTLRKNPILTKGNVEVLLATEKVLAVIRRLKPHPPVVLLINASDGKVMLDASGWLDIPEIMNVYVASVHSGITPGTTLNTTKLKLPGAATVVLANVR